MTDSIVKVLCEGQSESAFIDNILMPYIGEVTDWKIILRPIIVITSQDRDAGRVYKGGILNYEKVSRNLLNCLSQGKPVTTMFDFFRLPGNFPGYDEIRSINLDIDKVIHLEKSLKEDVLNKKPDYRADYFIPYIQLHEFEALFFCDLLRMKDEYLSEYDRKAIDKLYEATKDIPPEDINNGEETAPSKRLLDAVRYKKGQAVTISLKKIGVEVMKEKCPHFNEWIERILNIY